MATAKAITASLALGMSAFGLVACSGGAESETVTAESGYELDMLELDGTETLAFEPDPRLDPADQSTIEFWVKAGWSEDPGFDPVMLSNAGPDGASYLLAIDRERDGLIVSSGEQTESVPFDFADGKAHHVALIDLGNPLAVLVDGQVAAQLEMTLMPLPSDGLYIGSAYGEDDGFVGAIGGLRIWDAAIATDVLETYRLRDVLSESDPHPDLQFLALISNFADQDVVLIDR
ncbi:LamG domain-containing protein [Erythrobacter sp. THAF29]|uniref:LamG domain-containing protein n=1 Tax=Erythrobacter sp. THAF29 TaxID=2587851 RepID=UPI001269764B|nr:LamG domain-containing protein [Erythrobacter sp. THAF29]QFT78664.1 hypothetical protein FIU90_14030 [Erythrobacter sp. THAF29]